MLRRRASAAQGTKQVSTANRVHLAGIPEFQNGEAVIFDSGRPDDAVRLPDAVTFSCLTFRFLDGASAPGAPRQG